MKDPRLLALTAQFTDSSDKFLARNELLVDYVTPIRLTYTCDKLADFACCNHVQGMCFAFVWPNRRLAARHSTPILRVKAM